MKHTLFTLLLCVSLAGCGTARRAPSAPIILPDSVRVREEVRHITVYDTVDVALPRESSSVKTTDTISHLETSVAESDAWLTADGQLGHTLRNRPTLPLAIPHDTVYLTRDSIRTVYRPQPYEVTVEVPRHATLIEKILMILGGLWLLVIILKVANYLR